MDGAKALEIARNTIELWVRQNERYKPHDIPREFNEERGVFVTLHTYPGRELRGCIGFPYPVKSLWASVLQAAVQAAV